MRQCHTSCARGRRVRVKLRNGLVFVDKFHDRTKSYVFFQNRGRVSKADIVSFSFYKADREIC